MVTEDRRRADRWFARDRPEFPLLVDASREVARSYGVYKALGFDSLHMALPAFFLIDGGGVVRAARLLGDAEPLPDPLDLARVLGEPIGEAAPAGRSGSTMLWEPLLEGGARVRAAAEGLVSAHPDRVWTAVGERLRWDPEVIALQLESGAADRVGARFLLRERVSRRLPPVRTSNQVLLIDRPRRRMVRGRTLGAKYEVLTTLEPHGASATLLRVEAVLILSPALALLAPLARRFMRGFLAERLKHLQAHFAAPGPVGG